MKRTICLVAAGLAVAPLVVTTPAHAGGGPRPSIYQLTGDPVVGATGGSKFEGIGADGRRGTFYVSEVTGGEIHRGMVRKAQTQEWLGGDGTDGRFTARGITVDKAGRVYIAGGPNGIAADGTDNGRPDLWVYSPDGELLAALRAPGENAFLNDVWIGPDGAAYFTNSNAPQIFRVAREQGEWNVELWADASGTIDQLAGFNLGGIVLSPDRSAFVVAQGNVGRLWRFDVEDGSVTEVDTGGADLVGADGLVRQGSRLTVVRNFQRMVATLRLSADGSSARLVEQRATDPSRVLTTAKVLRGRMFFVDSKFEENPVGLPPYEVVTDPFTF
ncbi:gluconolaconase [Knoellia sinensis KCTC 19936]|uniref:Gluconolaconase n=1 Tax=Knoellia sinensis KCTC 19936 TaxID=1385520 RepID=A0A0A0J2Q9_9MICO|nr:SMP-30/gluconolactonase/LRE family protein [Knoellia sinensis]KGN31670.1 gluconolaconase [Knoellia sinensis KCTC 19936]